MPSLEPITVEIKVNGIQQIDEAIKKLNRLKEVINETELTDDQIDKLLSD